MLTKQSNDKTNAVGPITAVCIIYDHHYNPIDAFDTQDEAIDHALLQLPSDDNVYMVGDDRGIDAMVFQGRVYRT